MVTGSSTVLMPSSSLVSCSVLTVVSLSLVSILSPAVAGRTSSSVVSEPSEMVVSSVSIGSVFTTVFSEVGGMYVAGDCKKSPLISSIGASQCLCTVMVSSKGARGGMLGLLSSLLVRLDLLFGFDRSSLLARFGVLLLIPFLQGKADVSIGST